MNKTYEFKSHAKATITVTDTLLVISRRGFVTAINHGHGLKNDKKIPIKNITALQFRKGTSFGAGYIQLSILGSNESKSGYTGAIFDENTITFAKKENNVAEELKNHLESLIYSENTDEIIKDTTSLDPYEEVKKAKELLDMGIISEEEFEIKKKELLKL